MNHDLIIDRNRDDGLARIGHFDGSILPGRQDEKGGVSMYAAHEQEHHADFLM